MDVDVHEHHHESLEVPVLIEDEPFTNQENSRCDGSSYTGKYLYLLFQLCSKSNNFYQVDSRRKSALWLQTDGIDSSISTSISYKSDLETVDVTNIVDGIVVLDAPSDSPLSDLDLLLAATYVEDATCGRHSDFKVSERHLKMYHLYQNKWGQYILFVIFGVHLFLALFEKPAVPGLEVSYWVR
ncbi:hypothetical protein SK128_005191 [Halocaridina rubra]|uniref:Uncharacterized protein n=1 Tax=Halocaridina rubra TaxID=373956 RepID=A0AAN9A7I6_HALRR